MENEDDVTTTSRRQAMRLSRNLGCSGAHEYEGSWMPCSSHEELKKILDQINSLDEKDGECLPCQQNKEKALVKRKKKGKKPVQWEQLDERGVTGIGTLADGSLVSGPVGSKAESKCPPATSNIGLNIKNRQNAIDTAGYGPLNPVEKNEPFWTKKAKRWSVTITESKKQLCGNCAVFIKTPRMLDCIEAGLGNEEGNAAWDVINAGDLGYCEAFDFKCASARTCDAWVSGGPITEEKGKQEEKALQTIGGGTNSSSSSGGYNRNARDADGDGSVQEGTDFARQASSPPTKPSSSSRTTADGIQRNIQNVDWAKYSKLMDSEARKLKPGQQTNWNSGILPNGGIIDENGKYVSPPKKLGNIDLSKRKPVKLPSGDTATIRSLSVGTEAGEVLIPTIGPNGEDWDPKTEDGYKKAWDHYVQTGQHLGIFNTPDEATVYGEWLHDREQARVFGPSGASSDKKQEKAAREIRVTDPDVFTSVDSARVRSRQLGCIGIRRYRTTAGGEAWMPCTNESDYRLRMGTSPLARQQADRREAAFVRRVALAVGKNKPRTKASSLARTPAPKKDRIVGSERNRTGSASGISQAGSIVLNDSIEKTLVSKVKIHNAEMQKQGKPAWSKASVGALKAVYRRGAGAFSRSHRPGMTRNQWAMGRVNAFLKILSSGKPSSKAYVTDNDLLPDSHPWKDKQKTLVQRTFLPGTVANLKEKTDPWMAKVLNDLSAGRIGADRPKRAKRGRPSLRTIGVDIAKRGGALVDEEGLLRCPPTTINPGQFTNWKLEGCNDPSGAAKKIRQRISAVDMGKVPENMLVSRQKLAEIAKPTMASNFIRQSSGAPVADEAVFRRMNPESRMAERQKALSELSKNVQRELEKILGDRNIDQVFASDLDSIAEMTKPNGSSVWTASQLEKIRQTSALLRELDKPEINVGVFGDDVSSGVAVPRNISFNANLSDIFDDNGNLTQDGVSEVFGWMADNVEELATPRDNATSTAIRATYDNQNGTVTFDVVDIFGSDEVSDEQILGIARKRGAEFVTDLSRLSEDDVSSAFVPSGSDRISSPYVPSEASTDIRVRQPRTTDQTGAMSRFAGQDRVNGKNYTHEQKATMINDLIGGVAGFEFLKPVRTRRSADVPYSEKERLAIDAQIDQAVKHMTENLMFLLGDPNDESMKEFRARAKHWYPVANQYFAEVAEKHGYHPSLVNAIAATISPQMDWNGNVALATHMAAMIKDPDFSVEDDVAKMMAKEMKKLTNNNNKLPSVLSTRQKLIKNLDSEITALKARRSKVSPFKKMQIDGRIAALEMQKDSVARDFDFITKAVDMTEEELAASFVGKRIEGLSVFETALAHRGHSALHGMRYINGDDAPLRKINLNPDVFGDMNPIYEDVGSGQGYLSNDLKAALILRYGDTLASYVGDSDSQEYRGFLSGFISGNVSSESKVRSFYNNINNPFDEYYKDITNDTWMGVGAFFIPAMAATTKWDGKPVNETDMLFNSLTSLGHGRGYGMVSAAIMNAAEEWKALTGEDFTKHPRAMQSVLWELARTRWENASKMQAIGFSRELSRAIAQGRSDIDISERHTYLDFVRLATMETNAFKQEGSPLISFLNSRGLDVSIESMAKMSYQDRLKTYASVLTDRRGRPLLTEQMLVPHEKVKVAENAAEKIIDEMDEALE